MTQVGILIQNVFSVFMISEPNLHNLMAVVPRVGAITEL